MIRRQLQNPLQGPVSFDDTKSTNSSITNSLHLFGTGYLNTIVPNTSSVYNIGTQDARWNNLYLSTGSVYFGPYTSKGRLKIIKIASIRGKWGTHGK